MLLRREAAAAAADDDDDVCSNWCYGISQCANSC